MSILHSCSTVIWRSVSLKSTRCSVLSVHKAHISASQGTDQIPDQSLSLSIMLPKEKSRDLVETERKMRRGRIRDYGEKDESGRMGIRQGSRVMNKMHKVHSKILMLFSFHWEARFASSSPDYDIFSQHSRLGIAHFNVNVSVCTNSLLLACENRHIHTHTHSHKTHTFQRRLLLLREANRAETIPALVPSVPFLVTDFLRNLLSDNIRHITLNWEKENELTWWSPTRLTVRSS